MARQERVTSLSSINSQPKFCCLIVRFLWGSSTVETSAGGQDTTVQEQNQTKQHLHKDHLDIIQQIFLFLFFLFFKCKSPKLALPKFAYS